MKKFKKLITLFAALTVVGSFSCLAMKKKPMYQNWRKPGSVSEQDKKIQRANAIYEQTMVEFGRIKKIYNYFITNCSTRNLNNLIYNFGDNCTKYKEFVEFLGFSNGQKLDTVSKYFLDENNLPFWFSYYHPNSMLEQLLQARIAIKDIKTKQAQYLVTKIEELMDDITYVMDDSVGICIANASRIFCPYNKLWLPKNFGFSKHFCLSLVTLYSEMYYCLTKLLKKLGEEEIKIDGKDEFMEYFSKYFLKYFDREKNGKNKKGKTGKYEKETTEEYEEEEEEITVGENIIPNSNNYSLFVTNDGDPVPTRSMIESMFKEIYESNLENFVESVISQYSRMKEILDLIYYKPFPELYCAKKYCIVGIAAQNNYDALIGGNRAYILGNKSEDTVKQIEMFYEFEKLIKSISEIVKTTNFKK